MFQDQTNVMGAELASAQASPALKKEAQEPFPKTNFVFILCDDLGYGDLGCYGHPIIKTPRLDQLGREGLRLTQCYSAAPVCSPARAGIITGRNPNRMGIHDWIPANSGIYLKKTEPSVARLLQSAGYATAHVGKWHLSGTLDGSEPTPGDHGFDHWFATQNNAAPSHQDPTNFVRNGKPVGKLTGYSSAIIVDEAVRWLDSLPKKEEKPSKPFCLFVWLHAPHEPVATPLAHQRPYLGIKEVGKDATKAIYYGSVAMIDAEVGRLLDHLDRRGLRDETLVMFTSDNGPETLHRYRGARHSHGSPGKMRGMKLHMYEAGYRVPGIVRWPGRIAPGTVSATPVCGTDILPTFCAIAGVPLPKVDWDGTNVAPLFFGQTFTRAVPLYWQYDKAISRPLKMSMLVDDGYKLLADDRFGVYEMYDLNADPHEKRDLAPAQPGRVARLAKLLQQRHAAIQGLPPTD